MKTISLSLFCVLLFAQGVLAQNEIVLYGLRNNINDDFFTDPPPPLTPADLFLGVDLLSINPATGEESFLFAIDGARSIVAGSSTYNADQDQYFFSGNDVSNTSRIYSLDLGAFDVASRPETADTIFDIEYNYADGKVYGIRSLPGDFTVPFDPNDPGFNDKDLVEIDLETGTVVVVSELQDTNLTSQGNSTFDPINNRFVFSTFINSVPHVVGIDVTTGETAFSTNLGSVDGQVLAFEYDWTNQRLLGIRQTSIFDLDALLAGEPFFLTFENFLVEIDVETGEVRDISATPAFEDTGVAIGGVAFDQQSGTYISYVADNTLAMISAETGQVFNSIELPENLYEIQVDNLAFARSLNLKSVAVQLGDINEDGSVGFQDVSPFVSLLAAGDFQVEADITQDGEVNFLDIGPFIRILSGN